MKLMCCYAYLMKIFYCICSLLSIENMVATVSLFSQVNEPFPRQGPRILKVKILFFKNIILNTLIILQTHHSTKISQDHHTNKDLRHINKLLLCLKLDYLFFSLHCAICHQKIWYQQPRFLCHLLFIIIISAACLLTHCCNSIKNEMSTSSP